MEDETVQVVMIPVVFDSFKRWLDDRGLHAFRIPGLDDEDDLPTYSVGIGRR